MRFVRIARFSTNNMNKQTKMQQTMREIKFRGKRLDNGKWISGDISHGNNGKIYICNFAKNFKSHAEVDPDTIGQYTGNRDKTGREIYEGDILRREWSYRTDPEHDDKGTTTGYEYEREGHIIAPVAFSPCYGFHTKGGYCLMHNPAPGELNLVACTINKLKARKSTIIGNIYENPELLKAPNS